MKLHFKSLLTLSLLASLAACSGGGGSNNTPTPPPSQPATQTLSGISLSGAVNSLNTGATTAAAHGSAGDRIEGASVTVVVYAADDTEIDRFLATTDENGAYYTPLPDYSEATGKFPSWIEVITNKDGYVTSNKVFRNLSSDSDLNALVRLARENVATLSRNDLAGGFTASGTPAFRFGLVRNRSNGEVAMVAGAQFDQARAAASHETLLDLTIPVDRVADDVDAITAGLAHFDPNDVNQVQAFPGDFIGEGDPDQPGDGISMNLGGASAAAETDEYRLISSVFAQIKLQDQDGNTLGLSTASGASAAASDNAVMYLQVPADSYENITEDRDPTTSGIQVPIYVYSGGWKFVGNGSLVEYNGTAYQEYGQGLPITPTDTVYVRITIEEANEWVQWVNLDWPIRASSTIQNVCFSGNVRYSGDQQTPFSGYMDVQLPDGGYEWAYITEGVISHQTLLDSNSPDTLDPANWSFNIWNDRTYANEALSTSGFTNPIITDDGTGSTCNDFGTIALENPQQCRLTGQVQLATDNSPAQNRSMFASDANGYWRWASTDAEGQYAFDVPCGRDITVQTWGDSSIEKVGNVNGAQGNDEASDDGSEVVINFSVANQAPIISVSGPTTATFYSSTGMATADFWGWAYDADSTDVSLSWECTPADTCDFVDPAAASSVSTYVGMQFQATAAGTYNWTVTASDGNKSASATGTIEVDDADNRKPIIVDINRVSDAGDLEYLYCYRASGTLTCNDYSRAGELTYRVSAYDPDGNPLTYAWSDPACGDAPECTFSIAGSSTISVDVTDTPPAGTTPQTATGTVAVTVQQNQAPFIVYAYADPIATETDGSDTNATEINLQAAAIDDADALGETAYAWSIDGGALSLSGSSAAIETGSLASGTHDVQLTVTDSEGASSTSSFVIRVGAPGNVNVIVQ